MQDRESQSDVNPGIVEQRLDDAPVERQGMQGSGSVEREGTQGGDVERDGLQGAPATEREAFDEREQGRREDGVDGARSGGPDDRGSALDGGGASH